MTVTEQIRRWVAQMPEGQPFRSAELLQFGSRSAVDQALSRLSKPSGCIMRVTRGVYVRSKINRYAGRVTPEPFKVAQVIARSKIEIHGAEAARHFHLTTQVPTQPIFYTSGTSRTFRMGRLKVCLKHLAERKLQLAGRGAGMGLIALWYLGKKHVTAKVIEKIKNGLPPAEFEELKASRAIMPAWMADAIHNYEKGQ